MTAPEPDNRSVAIVPRRSFLRRLLALPAALYLGSRGGVAATESTSAAGSSLEILGHVRTEIHPVDVAAWDTGEAKARDLIEALAYSLKSSGGTERVGVLWRGDDGIYREEEAWLPPP